MFPSPTAKPNSRSQGGGATILLAAGLAIASLLGGQTHAELGDRPSDNKEHWAWKPVASVAPPAVKDAAWVQSPIDNFILARLEAAGLRPAAPASREQLIRRVSFDLIGLPPTPAEVDAFVADTAPNAWEKTIDRLLASPHYGERWGRHWLDLARYADSNGYEYDEVRPDAWRYRDYVIDAFNSDKPYAQFIREQLAGDELDPENPAARIATGFNLLGPDMTDSSDQVQRRQNTLNDMTDTASLAFLGLTLGCARCHDHKFEPLTQLDYYRFQAFYASARFRKDISILPKGERPAFAANLARFEAERLPVQRALEALEGPHRTRLRAVKLARQSEEVREAHETPEARRTPAQRERVAETIRFVSVSQAEVLKELTADETKRYRELAERLKSIDARKPRTPLALGLEDDGKPVKSYLLERGDPGSKGAEVQPGFPAVLNGKTAAASGRRSTLANWIASERNPLTARVMVNRLWMHHFGRGIVRTPSDFGTRGELPTHPELLDYLADQFVRGGWRLKKLHKAILLSAAYQQSTAAAGATRTADPDNRLFGRMNRVRLEGEIIRDSVLAIAGRLNFKRGGPGVLPSNKSESRRRSVYLFARRNLRHPFLGAFDLPDSNLSCPRRERSTTAPQALALLNDASVVEAAAALAARLKEEADPAAAAYRCILGRRPSESERKAARAFLRDSPLSELCRALFNVNEFVYVD